MRLLFVLLMFSVMPARAEFAINMLGCSYTFGEHEDVVNSQHDMIGVEYSGVGLVHFRDQFDRKNNAAMYHLRTDLTDNIKVGVTAAYVHRYRPVLGVAPELILHIDGLGVRVLCLPEGKKGPSYCAFNLRIEIP